MLLHHHPSSSTTLRDSLVLPPALTSMRLSMDIPNPHGYHRVQCQNLEWFWFSELYGLGIDCPKAEGAKESEVAQKSCGCTIPAVLKARLDRVLDSLIQWMAALLTAGSWKYQMFKTFPTEAIL